MKPRDKTKYTRHDAALGREDKRDTIGYSELLNEDYRYPSGRVEEIVSLNARKDLTTGGKMDKRGSKRCYQHGRQVKCGSVPLGGYTSSLPQAQVKSSPFETTEAYPMMENIEGMDRDLPDHQYQRREFRTKTRGENLVPYTGKRGGTGCINTETGKIEYGDPTKCGQQSKKKPEKPQEQKFSHNEPIKPKEHKPIGGEEELISMLRKGGNFGLNIHVSDKNSKFKSASSYILSKGKKFRGSPLPATMVKGDPSNCFVNATRLILSQPDWKYVEGFVKIGHLEPVVHAWAIDENNRVIDNTLDYPENANYYGIVFNTEDYLYHLDKTKHYGVLGGKKEDVERILRNGVV